MIKLPLIASALLLAASTDTVWWRSDAGTVIGHRTGDAVTCTLTLDGGDSRFQVSWSAGMPTRAVIQGSAWRLQPGNVLDIAVRIGETWLGRGSGAPNIPAMTGPSTLMFVARDDIEGLLRQSPGIRIDAGQIQTAITVPPNRMGPLMQALDRCKAFITPRS